VNWGRPSPRPENIMGHTRVDPTARLFPGAMPAWGRGQPFRWDEGRRFPLRCELDAAFIHLCLTPKAEWRQPELLFDLQ
jgi:hypothetical protein